MPIPKAPTTTTTAVQRSAISGNGHNTAAPSDRPKWSPLTIDEARYCISIFQGGDQSGKTHLAFTAPPPILVMTFDPANMRGVARKFAGTKDIQKAEFEVPKGLIGTKALADIAKVEAARYTDIFTEAATGSYFRTIIMDREDETWELYRYDEFEGASSARSKTSAGTYFTMLNSQYKGMLKLCEKYKKNLIMIDAVGEEYKNNKPTGETKRAGFKHLGMLSQLTIECMRDHYAGFSAQVLDCRDDATKNGEVLTPKMIDERVAAATGDRPMNEAGEYEYWQMEWATIMAYLIGGHPNEWK